ncbi:MAG: ATP cone domain-containing protein [Patescibacteria group bacterium]
MQYMIKKANGELVPFDEQKVINCIKRLGVTDEMVTTVLASVKKQLKQNMQTRNIYAIVQKELKRQVPWAAARYNLRDAILRFGPAGFNFEKYVASILTAYGYKTELPTELKGACITHEVDVTAEKEGRTAFIEAKFRHEYSTHINVKDALATWARFLDLVDGSKIDLCPHFDEAWIVTNARFSNQVLQYGHCKNMVLIGWNHPRERTFAQMVDHEALYPITVVHDLKRNELEIFAKSNIMLCKEMVNMDNSELKKITGLPLKRIEYISKVCSTIVTGSDM